MCMARTSSTRGVCVYWWCVCVAHKVEGLCVLVMRGNNRKTATTERGILVGTEAVPTEVIEIEIEIETLCH